MKLLSIDDDKKTSKLLQAELKEHGFFVDTCHDGNKALERACRRPYDAILLETVLPERDGLGLLRELRERKKSTPILILSANGDLEARIEGLDAGADGYMTKPFSIDELAARLHALLRRVSGESLSQYKAGDLTMNLFSQEVRRGVRKLQLSHLEYRVLERLLRSYPQTVRRTQIIESAWAGNFDFTSNLVDVYVKRLRRKIDTGESTKMIRTVRGVGYRIEAE